MVFFIIIISPYPLKDLDSTVISPSLCSYSELESGYRRVLWTFIDSLTCVLCLLLLSFAHIPWFSALNSIRHLLFFSLSSILSFFPPINYCWTLHNAYVMFSIVSHILMVTPLHHKVSVLVLCFKQAIYCSVLPLFRSSWPPLLLKSTLRVSAKASDFCYTTLGIEPHLFLRHNLSQARTITPLHTQLPLPGKLRRVNSAISPYLISR